MSGITQVSSDDAGWRFAQCFGDKVSPQSRLASGLAEQGRTSSYTTRNADHALAHSAQGEVEDITEADIICKSLPSTPPRAPPPIARLCRALGRGLSTRTSSYKWNPLAVATWPG